MLNNNFKKYLRINETQQVSEKQDPHCSENMCKCLRTFSVGSFNLNIRIFLLSKRNIHTPVYLRTYKIKNKNVFKDDEQLQSSTVHAGKI